MNYMAACYPNQDLSISQGLTAAVSIISQQHHISQVMKKTQENLQDLDQSSHVSTGAAASLSSASVANLTASAKNYINTPKDYFAPLHVDCSVEYELPKQPKPPAGQRVEPLLMIHPCYFRKMESQSRSPFINNMPNSSRNGSATFVGVALISQDSNITPVSASTLSVKKSSIKNHQHHYHPRQNLSLQYGSVSHSDRQQLHTPHQHKPQYNFSLVSQQAHYPIASAKFLKHSLTPIRRTSIARSNQSSHHILCSTPQTKNESNQQGQPVQKTPLFQSSSSQWDQLAAVTTFVKSSINDQNPNNISSPSINNLCEAAGCSIAKSSNLGKRDGMISGSVGYRSNSAVQSNNISLEIQTNKNSSNNITSSPGKHHHPGIIPNETGYGISTSLVDRTKLSWNPKTNTTSSFYMIAQSPIAAVPSNFQAGPDTTPTTAPFQNKYKTINDNNNENSTKNNILTSGKFRQYVKSHRVYPYLTGTYLHSDSAGLSLSSKSSSMATRGDFKVLPQFSAAKTAVAAVSTATSFQQHMQQISCYNV